MGLTLWLQLQLPSHISVIFGVLQPLVVAQGVETV
jgi:hypothetical protein